ncbi:TPA: MFS transporter [Acinetobacter baumannii]|uniref:MFS transporter n=1 Tax=Acinetobacter baumannii TaxID=470 RepID=UPI0029595E2A|nr:MFS transporter [Acinetobacter baumannii]HBM1759031.1 MFS transporter [Acinetobacter baumannii]HBM1854298.1 MFS transporter [Acinetobacter baumannii]HBM1989445.1 MFS transporter [Acinetobacter baumannii]HBM2033851.1 MFS transporter [Acinetobacter baumannii]
MSLKKVHRHSWVSLVICWIIWVVVAYDRELIFRAANMICNEFNLSPTQWGYTIAAITLSLAVLSIPVAALSDKHASGWKRGIFQWPLVIGFTFISLLSGITSLSSSFYKFVTLRIMVSLGCGVAEPVGVSNTAEWWPKEHRGFAIGAHHSGYPVGALLSGVAFVHDEGEEKTSTHSTWERLKQTLSSRGIVFTAASTLITHVVYIGFLTIFPAFLYNIVGLDLAKSAGLSAVFTITGMMGQIIWPTLSDKIGRRLTLILCGCWMAVSIASFCLTSGVVSVIAIQLFFGLSANAIWPIFYATASDYAPAGAIGTANSLITVAQYVGGAVAPIIMGYLLTSFGGWHSHQGYIWCFLLMSCCAFIGVILQIILGYLIKKEKSEQVDNLSLSAN